MRDTTVDTIEAINELITEDRLDEAATVLADLPDARWEGIVREMADGAAQVNMGAAQHEEMYAVAGRLETLAEIVRKAAAQHDPLA